MRRIKKDVEIHGSESEGGRRVRVIGRRASRKFYELLDKIKNGEGGHHQPTINLLLVPEPRERSFLGKVRDLGEALQSWIVVAIGLGLVFGVLRIDPTFVWHFLIR